MATRSRRSRMCEICALIQSGVLKPGSAVGDPSGVTRSRKAGPEAGVKRKVDGRPSSLGDWRVSMAQPAGTATCSLPWPGTGNCLGSPALCAHPAVARTIATSAIPIDRLRILALLRGIPRTLAEAGFEGRDVRIVAARDL